MLMDPGDHSPECAVHEARTDVLTSLAAEPADPYLLGAVVEYYGFGDQEAEVCTCDWTPTGALARAMLGDDEFGETDHVVIYERLRPLVSDRDYRDLGAALELCPVHAQDIRICLDDGMHGEEVYL
jgi:hypothetical protein